MNDKQKLPNKAFDTEYMTEWMKEVRFLESQNIKPTFVKVTPDYHIKQYKYKKTSELFSALYEFYKNIENENEFNKLVAFIETYKEEVPAELKEFIAKRIPIAKE